MRQVKGPEFIRFFRPILELLLKSGGTGTFPLEAKKEARRDGVPPIELVDGDVLVEMFERLELGLIPKRIYDIDERFFDDYKEQKG